MIQNTGIPALVAILVIFFLSCAHNFGSAVIAKPDEYTHVFEAKEKIILKAVAAVIKEKSIGEKVSIDFKNNSVDSDYVIANDWRTKANARVRRLNWKECEMSLTVTTEKKTDKGWEMRRLLEKEQYENFFKIIELRIYEEMSRVE